MKEIVETVQKKGDEALLEYTREFDGINLSGRGVAVKESEIREAYEKVGEEQIDALTYLKARIAEAERYNLKKLNFSRREKGLTISHSLKPIPSVGCYVPGGKAAYPSTLLMEAVPAKVAGVPRIAVCSPPTSNGEINPLVLVAADICGVSEIYRVGGAQAVAALAYGTESISPVMKIVGPGNRFVTIAKALVSRDVAVDFPAGPSEVLVLADEAANSRFVALDLISQSEHSPDSVAGLVTTSEDLAKGVVEEIENLFKEIEREEVVAKSLSENGFVLVCDEWDEAISFVNAFAPEHLEILTRRPSEIAKRIVSAGVILLGPYTPVSGSDYCFGTSHILPTGGFSRVYSGLSVIDFVRRVNVVKCSRERLEEVEGVVKVLALGEALPNHFLALNGRVRD